ncbi:hypothetical protein D3C80_1718590 [compost metagenome]
MRMTEDQLVVQSFNHIINTEGAQLLFHLRMEHDLQQQIPQLFLHVVRIILIDCFQHLVGFLDQILTQRIMRLLTVPRTALRTSQGIDNFMETGKGAFTRILRTVGRNIDQ